MTPALAWLEERLAAQGTTADEVVRDEHQRQGAANVTVRNIITSMRLISDVDWTELFESVSLVDDVLCAPAATFADDGFRHPQPLPQRHRGTGARLRPHGARHRPRRRPGGGAARSRHDGDGDRPTQRSRLSPDRRRAPGLRSGDRLPATAARLAADA